ncbi:MAG TPA: carboxypeptidase-like regulatory domain-containing protein, partial [Bryobacteraceae bacterium]|nr:carboxypeptidase-like regulatory domain-containing protein [Bryobacteraceae bacterium]
MSWKCWAIAVSLALATMPFAFAQGETTSAIAGQVTDATGAAISDATVTLIGADDGSKRSARTDQTGRFSFPQLKPGSYTVRAHASNFEDQTRSQVAAGLGQTQTVNFVLSIKAAQENIVVTTDAPLINTENPNTATTLNAKAIENLPNPGSDLTYPAQFAPGALINTAGSSNDFVGGQNGYGNVQFNGLPALSNAYIVDGLETNDPLTNLNSGLSTNLVLGLNSIAEVTVNTTSYAVDQGRYGAAQINYITKSGGNSFHGNLYELWNGSHLNAANYFTNSTPGNQKPRSNVNHFGGSLGGPIAHDKLFFFFDGEWLRIALPIVTPVTVPSPQFQNYVLSQLPQGGVDPVTGAHYPAAPQMVAFYQRMFALYQNTAGTPLPVLGCPLGVSGTGCANRQDVSQSSADHEQVFTARIDHNLSADNSMWYRFQADTGVQAAYTDPINPLFNATSPQPLYSFASGYTHLFSPSLVNYFNPAFSWYASLFGPLDPSKTSAAFPIVLAGVGPDAPFTTIGGLDNNWIQGRRASRFQISDSLSWVTGRHQFKFGLSGRVLRLNDFDFSTNVTPLVTYTTLAQFTYGVASTATASYPVAASQPFNYLNLDLFALDTIRLSSSLTWT